MESENFLLFHVLEPSGAQSGWYGKKNN
uniref:Uncharacterized protein n=1 Tax=Rhizophora mucronata TaxID=61149 RepID=A0A2P2NC69_RHIMU